MKTLKASRKFKIYKAARRELCARFPLAFPWKGRRPTLKVGIFDDLRAAGLERVSLTDCRVFLRIWTGSTAYLVNVREGRARVALDGAPQGAVSAGHVAEAAVRLATRRQTRGTPQLTSKS